MTIHTSKRAEKFTGGDVGAALSLSVHRRPKYHLRAGLQYLHWSGSSLTSNRDHAWSGNIDQARACRRTFDAAAGCKTVPVSSLPMHEEQEV